MMVSPVSVLLMVAVTTLVGKAEVNVPSIDIYDQELRHNESMQLLDLLRGKESESCKNLAGKCTKKKDCDVTDKYVKKICSKNNYVCCIPKSVDTMCKWKMDGARYPANPPIIVNKENSNKIILPELDKDGKRILRVPDSKDLNLIISCPGEYNTFEDNTFQTNAIEAKCIPGKVPKLQTKDGKEYTLYNLRCSSKVMSTIIEVTKNGDDPDAAVGSDQRCSSDNEVLLKIGFQITALEFNSMIDVCFSKTDQTTLWTEHTIYGDHIAAKPDNGRPSWISDYEYFNVCVDRIYNAMEQFKFDLKTFQKHFISGYTSENKYFARGHLSAKGDFTLEAESDATFHLINALPQWQRFNSAWGTVEKKIRDFAERLHREKKDNNLRIITGGFGKINLKHINNADVEFWLGEIDNNIKKVPIPAVIWKVVISNALERSVAFLINNNPEVDIHHNPCANPIACEDLKWYNPGNGKITIYCCLVDDLRNMDPNVPANIHEKPLIYPTPPPPLPPHMRVFL